MFPGSITVVDITGQATVETGLVWEDGDADRSMKPIPGTLVRTPWGGDQAAQFLVDFYELDGTPHDLDPRHALGRVVDRFRSEEHTSELQSLMRISYAVFCLKKKKKHNKNHNK